MGKRLTLAFIITACALIFAIVVVYDIGMVVRGG